MEAILVTLLLTLKMFLSVGRHHPKNLRSFQGEYPWRSSVPVKLLPFANHRNFTYDSENYELQNFIIIL